MYDSRGHPVNPWARSQERILRNAQNDVLAAVGVVERKIPELVFGGDLDAHGNGADAEENTVGDMIGNAADFDYQCLSWWIHAFTNRLLVRPWLC